jgi:hypothetical protein
VRQLLLAEEGIEEDLMRVEHCLEKGGGSLLTGEGRGMDRQSGVEKGGESLLIHFHLSPSPFSSLNIDKKNNIWHNISRR